MAIANGSYPDMPKVNLAAGLRTQFGNFTPPGGKVVAYVHSSGPAITDDPDIAKMLRTTLNAALALCTAGKGDTVLVLPGHAENIASADQMSNLKAGTRIIGLGQGASRPTFTWTTATSTFLFDVANVSLENCILNMDPGAGTVTVAAPITISAAGCRIADCKIRVSTDANSKTTIPITTTAAAVDLELLNLDIRGATAGEVTTVVQLVGADRLRMIGCTIAAATSAVGVGVMRFLTTASTFIQVYGCVFKNNKASSTAAVTGMAGVSGEADCVQMNVLSGGASAWGTVASMTFGPDVTATNTAGHRGAAFGTASTLA
jgi:hypothetical protein